jgi:hypothetical protein
MAVDFMGGMRHVSTVSLQGQIHLYHNSVSQQCITTVYHNSVVQVLTVDQTAAILVQYWNCKDWKRATQTVVPDRKTGAQEVQETKQSEEVQATKQLQEVQAAKQEADAQEEQATHKL